MKRAPLGAVAAASPTLLALIALAACKHEATDDGSVARTDPAAVHVDAGAFRDGLGRQLLFRGYNAKVVGLFDVTFDDGRAPNETFPGFDEAGAQRFEELGFDVMRMPVSWSALEPHPQAYSDAFLKRIDDVLAMAERHHFYVIVDMHQDAYSKEIGEDGAPLWAIVPPPPQLLSGPYDDARRLTAPVLNAGFNFFANANATDGRPLEDAFYAAVQTIARHVRGRPSVLGFEAFNEPVVLHQDELDDFHARFADAIHAVDRDAPILFEPMGTRNQTDHAKVPLAPWSHGAGAYAPHIYTGQFSVPDQHGWESEDPAVLAPSMQAAQAEAQAWGTPLFVTEFGCDQSVPRGAKWLSAELDLQDRALASSTAWAWEPGSWGFTDGKADGPNATPSAGPIAKGSEWPATARTMARPYPRAVAGDLLAIERPDPSTMRVHYRATARTRGLPHEVSVSKQWFADYVVTCDGAPAAATAATGRATFVCDDGGAGEHVFEVHGTLAP